jgi:DNA-binding MarR family transcriptional regulator
MAGRRDWHFLTSHAIVLLKVAESPGVTVRELAESAAITERQTHRVLADLVDEGYVSRRRSGRRNVYEVERSRRLRHPAVAARSVGELLQIIGTR